MDRKYKQLILLFLISFVTIGYGQREISGNRSMSTLIDFDYRTSNGNDTTFTDAAIDSFEIMFVSGDSVYSKYFQNIGSDFSVQAYVSGGTPDISVIIQNANKSSIFADSCFSNAASLAYTGASLSNCYFSDDLTGKITAEGNFPAVLLPVLSGDVFRLFLKDGGSHSGTTYLKFVLARRR